MPCGLSVSALFLCSPCETTSPSTKNGKIEKLTEKRSRNETFFILQLGMQNVVVVVTLLLLLLLLYSLRMRLHFAFFMRFPTLCVSASDATRRGKILKTFKQISCCCVAVTVVVVAVAVWQVAAVECDLKAVHRKSGCCCCCMSRTRCCCCCCCVFCMISA